MSCFLTVGFHARLLTIFFFASLLTVSGHSQIHGPTLRVVIPFAFESADNHFAAGTYFVRVENWQVVLASPRGQGVMPALRQESLDLAPKNQLVFRRYGTRYFLREVWVAGQKSHVQCRMSNVERAAQDAMAQQHQTGVAVALLENSK